MSVLWGLLLLACAAGVVLLALFEIAFFSSSEIAVRALDEEPEEARALRERLADPLAVLIPTRLGLLACAALAGLAVRQTGAGGGGAWAWFPPAAAGAYLLLREVVPAAVLLRDPERVLRRLLPLFRRFEALLRPAAEPLRRLLRRFFPVSEEVGEEATDEEVEAFLETGEEEGILEEDEAEMVRGVLELDEMLVREVMTPRTTVVSVESGASVAEVERLVAESRHHRIPVFRDRGEGGVAGLVDAVDLIAARRKRGGGGLTPLLREVRVVPETKRVDDLLEEFKRSRQTFAVVVDERGSVSGIVTLRDISEEIVGEVREDGEGADVEQESEGVFLARGGAEPDLVSRATGLRLPESVRGAAYDTLSGFVVAAMGRIPEAGEVVEAEGVRVEVLEADARRVHRLRLRRSAPPEASPGSSADSSGAED